MIVVGAGRVGTALRDRAAQGGAPCTLVGRVSGWEALDGPQGDPVLLAVRNDDLLEVVARTPAHRRGDLVFLQNGMFRDLLRDNGLGGCTRGLLYFAVARRGDPITPGGTSWFSGPHALPVARWLGAMGVTSQAVDWARYTFFELEKACWLAAMGPLCTVHGASVGEVAVAHRDALEDVVAELLAVGRAAFGVEVPLPYLVQRLCDYSLSIADYRASVKEWPWRNGWFYAQAARYGVDMTANRAAIQAAGCGHLLGSS